MKIIRFLVFLFALFILFSCKKNSPTPKVGTISATIAGVAQNFNGKAQAVVEGNQSYLAISGQNCDCLTGNSIQITISNQTPISTGTYVAAAFDALATNTGIRLIEYPPYAEYTYDNKISASNFTVVIKSISATNVQGTFSGTLALYVGDTGVATTQTITKGTFNLNTSPGQ